MKFDPPFIWLPAYIADAIDRDLATIVADLQRRTNLAEILHAEHGFITTTHHKRPEED